MSEVNRAGEVLEEVDKSISVVTDTIGRISEAMREQYSGISEITTVVAQMDGNTQQNVQLADLSRGNSDELASQARTLKSALDMFQIGSGMSGTASIKSPEPAPHGTGAEAPTQAPAPVAGGDGATTDMGGDADEMKAFFDADEEPAAPDLAPEPDQGFAPTADEDWSTF